MATKAKARAAKGGAERARQLAETSESNRRQLEEHEREKLGMRALDAFVAGRFGGVTAVVEKLGPGYLRLRVNRNAGLAELSYHPDGDAGEPLPAALSPTQVLPTLDHLRKARGLADVGALLSDLLTLGDELRGDDGGTGNATDREERLRQDLARTGFGHDVLLLLLRLPPNTVRAIDAFNGCGQFRRWAPDATPEEPDRQSARKALAAMAMPKCKLLNRTQRGQYSLAPHGLRIARTLAK